MKSLIVFLAVICGIRADGACSTTCMTAVTKAYDTCVALQLPEDCDAIKTKLTGICNLGCSCLDPCITDCDAALSACEGENPGPSVQLICKLAHVRCISGCPTVCNLKMMEAGLKASIEKIINGVSGGP